MAASNRFTLWLGGLAALATLCGVYWLTSRPARTDAAAAAPSASRAAQPPRRSAPSAAAQRPRRHEPAAASASQPLRPAPPPARAPAPERASAAERPTSMAERRAAAAGRSSVGRTRALDQLRSLHRFLQQPGLCPNSADAPQPQAAVTSGFVDRSLADTRFLVDPRLPADAHLSIAGYLEEAEREVALELQLEQPRPEVFLYADVESLREAACTNGDVVAYYDGALHVVPGRADARESVVHEYTHHALRSSGFFAPTWAQEGMAMLVARETWWREPEWLGRVLEQPLELELLEQGVPYTLDEERAALFYAQAASMAACAARDHATGLAGLLAELRVFAEPGGEPSYALPPPADGDELRRCVQSWLR